MLTLVVIPAIYAVVKGAAIQRGADDAKQF